MVKIYLGIHAGHNASAALMVNGSIVIAVQEERFSKLKNHGGYPKQSIDFCLNYAKENGLQINKIGFSTTNLSAFWAAYPIHHYYNMKDYHNHYGSEFYGPKLQGKDVTSYYEKIISEKDKNRANSYLPFDKFESTEEMLNNTGKFRQVLTEFVCEQSGVGIENVVFLDHHTCHAFYAYFGSERKADNCIVITMDSIGDDLNLTVWNFSNGKAEKLRSTGQCDIGRIYKITTLLLGMKPDEHEFKVMGMDPYAKSEYVDVVYNDVYESLLKVEDALVIHKHRPADMYAYLMEKLKPYRFDNIAGAVQKFVEVLTTELFQQAHKITGLRDFCISGGVSMNIKMNMILSELDIVDSLQVPASGSDESLAMGACYYLNGFNSNHLPNTYLGNEITQDTIDAELSQYFPENSCRIEKNVSHRTVAEMIASGKIIAAVRGREEFGARALGNRSILASPNDPEVIKTINEVIKNRDFWMPFALSILEDFTEDYFVNPKQIQSKYMTLGFKTKDQNYSRIKAGTHPYDRTCRPQFISKTGNPEYYDLVKEYYAITGTPALLNTSLNLHGNPICSSLEDVSHTFFNSSLEYVYLNDSYLISKKLV